MEVSEALKRLEVDPAQGLSETEVKRRRARFGPNELIERGPKSAWKIIEEQLTGILIVMLVFIATFESAFGQLSDVSLRSLSSESKSSSRARFLRHLVEHHQQR